MHEEAFAIYAKFSHHAEALGVLLAQIADIERAAEYASRVNEKEVWSQLAAAQLGASLVGDAIDSYIKAGDPSNFEGVIRVAEGAGKWEDLVRFLEMARKAGTKERAVDSALVYALAQAARLGELESFVTSPNVADLQHIGDRAFEEGLFEAARILYAAVGNNGKLASTLVALGLFAPAVEAARKANSIKCWKEVSSACIRAGEFKLALTAGLAIIVSPDHLEELISFYEGGGHAEELIKLLEQGVGLDNAHAGVFTELGVMYSRYRPEALFDHIRAHASRMNVSKMLRACEAGRHWCEAVFLHTSIEDFDAAVKTMMDHAPTAFALPAFLEAM